MVRSVQAAARLDALPVGSFHRRLIWLVGLGMFFDSFDNTLSGSVLASMLHSGFSSMQLNSMFLSATYGGLAIGAGFAGWLSDRFGRSFAFQFNLALFGILALCCALAPSMPVLITVRGIMGIGMGAEYVMCYGLITEFVPVAKRGRYLGMLGIFAGLGVSMTSALSLLIIPTLGWRTMFLIGGVGTLVVWWLRRGLPESPRWLEAVGRHDEAEAILQKIETECGIAPSSIRMEEAIRAADKKGEWVPITILFTPQVLRRTLLAILLNVTCLFGSYSITGWMPTFFIRQGMSVTQSLGFNAAMMAGYVAGPLICVFFADRIGRRHGILAFGMFSAVFAAIYPQLTNSVAIMSCGFLLVGSVASFLVLGLGSTPELFPTEYRFRGGGVAQTAGRLGLIVSPFIVLGLFNTYGIAGVIGAISGMYVVVTLLIVTFGSEIGRSASVKA